MDVVYSTTLQSEVSLFCFVFLFVCLVFLHFPYFVTCVQLHFDACGIL